MAKMVHARLDEQCQKKLVQLVSKFGWNESKIIRESIKLMANISFPPGESRIIGMGQFKSKHSDLGSNKKRLRDFGR